MTQVRVDIATRLIGATEDIYVVRPGEKFRFYRDFESQNLIFLDFPDIGLELDKPKPGRKALREAVIRSMARQAWLAGGQRGNAPSTDPQDYIGAANGRRVGRYVSAVEKLYYQLPIGTIVVVPGPGYFSDTLIGEITGPTIETTRVGAYPGERFPARPVRWIGSRAKARFPEALRERLQKPLPLIILERSLRANILEAAFEQYSIGGVFSARLKTAKDDFSALDDYNIQTALNYFAGALVPFEEGREERDINLNRALALLKGRRDLVLELKANVNSRGDLRFFSPKIAPLVAAVLFAIAMAVPSGTIPSEIHVVNSAVAGGDPCALHVQEQAMAIVKMMDIDTWHKVCVQVRDAHEHTGLATGIKVTPMAQTP